MHQSGQCYHYYFDRFYKGVSRRKRVSAIAETRLEISIILGNRSGSVNVYGRHPSIRCAILT